MAIIINNRTYQLPEDEGMPLLWFLRDIAGVTGTKYGCGIGVCGACTVHVNGKPVRACQMPVKALTGQRVTTIEALAGNPTHPVLQAWLEISVAQCGFCQPGQIMEAAALLARNPDPSDEEIAQAMAGHLCRCGTYPRIVAAIRLAAAKMRDQREKISLMVDGNETNEAS